ncbi:FAD-dependent monooxygenase [Nocardia sp. NEAU-G5]|uniref:FAD-dependent monooxygenase n=1 Tax=Nocardia albiluteola TaxID=2842303 RepID=A0ABS6BA95_9NOCA|nr:FAD-dependent monooxygenase [Nocardia albiluteola]MBU3067217.1 FAD-dependent monooxygenase [Nocardia albiluteola]
MTATQQFTNKTVLISGASVAGPALAYWLARYGFTVTVVEQAPALREGGYKVDIRGVAMEVVDRMGLTPQVRAASTAMRGGAWVDDSGKALATLGPELIGLRSPGDDEVLRGDLARILFDATKDNVEYLFGDSITDLQQHADGVTVQFRNAAPRVFDLVIGADGMHSAVRRLAFGPEEQFARHTGMAACVISVSNHLNLDHWELVHPTPGRVVQVYSTRQATAKTQFIFQAPQQLPDRRDRAAQQQLVANAFADAGWETPNLVRALPESPDFYFDSVSQIHLDQWSRGRVALVGDAAYCPSPLSGQGTSMALVGAYVLAGELKATAGHVAAFDRYQRAMQDYVTENLTLGWNNATQMVAADRRAIRTQTTMLRMLRYMPWKGLALRPIIKPLERAANAIRLTDY